MKPPVASLACCRASMHDAAGAVDPLPGRTNSTASSPDSRLGPGVGGRGKTLRPAGGLQLVFRIHGQMLPSSAGGCGAESAKAQNCASSIGLLCRELRFAHPTSPLAHHPSILPHHRPSPLPNAHLLSRPGVRFACSRRLCLFASLARSAFVLLLLVSRPAPSTAWTRPSAAIGRGSAELKRILARHRTSPASRWPPTRARLTCMVDADALVWPRLAA